MPGRIYNILETKINQGGLMRCCLDTIYSLARTAADTQTPILFVDGAILDCKHEFEGNKKMILEDGRWRWNPDG